MRLYTGCVVVKTVSLSLTCKIHYELTKVYMCTEYSIQDELCQAGSKLRQDISSSLCITVQTISATFKCNVT